MQPTTKTASISASTDLSWVRRFFDIVMKYDVLSMASSMAYYTVLSITPLLLLIFATLNFIGWNSYPDFQRELIETLGPTIATALQSIQGRLQESGSVIDFGIFTLLTFIFSSMGIVSELQRTLNTILFGLPNTDGVSTKQAMLDWIKTRGFALLALVVCIFVVVGSFALSVAFRFYIQAQNEVLWEIVRFTASFLIFSGVFFFLFRYLPSKRQTIFFAARAGVICSSLFHIGKYLIESYFLRVDMTSGYGALSSFVLLLLWAYYNGLVIILSACLSKALFHEDDSDIVSAEKQ